MTPGPTVDITQAADLMKVHPKTVLDKINSGALAAGKMGRAYVIMTKDVLALIEHEIISQTAKRMGTPQRHQSRVVPIGRAAPKRDKAQGILTS